MTRCPRCGSTDIQRWPCPMYAENFSPYNDDVLLCIKCRHREGVKKGIIPDNWK